MEFIKSHQNIGTGLFTSRAHNILLDVLGILGKDKDFNMMITKIVNTMIISLKVNKNGVRYRIFE